MEKNLIDWVDLGVENAQIRVLVNSNSTNNIIITGNFDRSIEDKLNGISFKKSDEDIFIRESPTFKWSEIKNIFINAKKIKKEYNETRIEFKNIIINKNIHKKGNEKKVNNYQTKYVPGSKNGDASACIPTNLAIPTRKSLERIESIYGDIDEYVANELKWSKNELIKYLSAEQIDAVATFINAVSHDNAFLLGDQTGLGKGRVVAAMARYAVLKGMVACIVTEKENLFSDFWRDVVDIGSDELFGRPFILNNGAEITKGGGKKKIIIHEAWKANEVANCIKEKKIPDGIKIFLSTYTQFNRLGSQKTEFLANIVKNQAIICDECHNAVGDSNTSSALSMAMDNAGYVAFSSATFAKNAKSLVAYKRLFPKSMRSDDLLDILSSGGRNLYEALSQMLAENGTYLRREQDLSGIDIKVVVDRKNKERHAVIADELSKILSKIASLSREVAKIAEEKNGGKDDESIFKARNSKEGFWYTNNFGQGLSVIKRQFITVLLVDMCIEYCENLIDRGIKPVVVIETTMESLMKLLIEEGKPKDDLNDDLEEAEIYDQEDNQSNEENVQPPTFSHAMQIFLNRMMTLKMKKKKEDPVDVAVERSDLVKKAEEISNMIKKFPIMNMSPIDDIKDELIQRFEKKGKKIVVDEISARSLKVENGEYSQIAKRDRVGIVSGFNEGEIDALVITKAASTGLSLHSSEKFEDKRPRAMLELQIAQNVVERFQFFGRVNRRGQVNIPEFYTLTTDLPMQIRSLAMQNKKAIDLSANVTGNAKTYVEMDIPDLLNPIGNKICKEILEERPYLAEKMFIAMRLKDQKEAEKELYHVNKVLDRLILLPSKEQDSLFEEICRNYIETVEEMSSLGITKGDIKILDGEWEEIDDYMIEPEDKEDGEVFGQPLYVTTIERETNSIPMRWKEIEEIIKEERSKGIENKFIFKKYLEEIEKRRNSVLLSVMGDRFVSIDHALRDHEENIVIKMNEKINKLKSHILYYASGCHIKVGINEDSDLSGNNKIYKEGVILRLEPPSNMSDVVYPGRWKVVYVLVGDEKPKKISLAQIIGNNGNREIYFKREDYNEHILKEIKEKFNNSIGENKKERRKILTGNLMKAAMMNETVVGTQEEKSERKSIGDLAAWKDKEGNLKKNILVHKKYEKYILKNGRTTSIEKQIEILNSSGVIFTSLDEATHVKIEKKNDEYRLRCPSDLKVQKKFKEGKIKEVVPIFKGGVSGQYTDIDENNIEKILNLLKSDGYAFYYKNIELEEEKENTKWKSFGVR